MLVRMEDSSYQMHRFYQVTEVYHLMLNEIHRTPVIPLFAKLPICQLHHLHLSLIQVFLHG